VNRIAKPESFTFVRRCCGQECPRSALGKNIGKLHTRTRLSHHRRDRVPPGLVMSGFLVRCRGVRVAINLHQHESAWVVLLLDGVESGDSRLFETLLRVSDCRLFEWL